MIRKIQPVLFILLLIWIVYFLDGIIPFEFSSLGIVPRNKAGLTGIVCSPFLHGNMAHILSNTFSFLILGSMLFAVYAKYALKVFLYSGLISGFIVWALARPAVHIGLSGIIYAFASFLIFAGFFNRKMWGIFLSIAVILAYGGLIWGLLPGNVYVSWEGHIAGAFSGYLLASSYYRKKR